MKGERDRKKKKKKKKRRATSNQVKNGFAFLSLSASRAGLDILPFLFYLQRGREGELRSFSAKKRVNKKN